MNFYLLRLFPIRVNKNVRVNYFLFLSSYSRLEAKFQTINQMWERDSKRPLSPPCYHPKVTSKAKKQKKVPEKTTEEVTEPPKAKFRLNRKAFFLTYPQCPLLKEIVGTFLQTKTSMKNENKSPRGIYIMVAEEKHKDGTPHLHAIVLFNQEFNLTDPTFFDIKNHLKDRELLPYHPNIQGMKSLSKSLEYLTKEDHSPFTLGLLPEHELMKKQRKEKSESRSNSEKKSVSVQVSEAIQNKVPLKQLKIEFPGYVLNNLAKIQSFISYTEIEKRSDDVLPWKKVHTTAIVWPNNVAIIDWVNDNLFKERQFKQKQLFIWGPPNSRKTSFVEFLQQRARVYHASGEQYFDNYSDDLYDLAVFDEYNRKHRSYTAMNSFLDGSKVNLHCRYHPVYKAKRIPCIILSNMSLEEIYPPNKYPVALMSLRSRLLEVQLTEDEVIMMERIQFYE